MPAHLEDDERHGQRRRRSRSGASCRRVRGSARPRRPTSSAPAPCRRSGSRLARRAPPVGALGRSICRRPAEARRGRGADRDSAPARRRTARGSGNCRSNIPARHARRDAAPSPDRPSSRTPDRSRYREMPPVNVRDVRPRSLKTHCSTAVVMRPSYRRRPVSTVQSHVRLISGSRPSPGRRRQDWHRQISPRRSRARGRVPSRRRRHIRRAIPRLIARKKLGERKHRLRRRTGFRCLPVCVCHIGTCPPKSPSSNIVAEPSANTQGWAASIAPRRRRAIAWRQAKTHGRSADDQPGRIDRRRALRLCRWT